jgi:hypothetical protein
MKKRGKVNSHISNRLLYTLITLGILIIVSTGVYAWASANGVGHAYSELQTCTGTQILKMNGAGAWACATDAVGGGITTETDPTVMSWAKTNSGAISANSITISSQIKLPQVWDQSPPSVGSTCDEAHLGTLVIAGYSSLGGWGSSRGTGLIVCLRSQVNPIGGSPYWQYNWVIVKWISGIYGSYAA